MRNYRVYLALLVVVMAVIGALLHPFALLLALAPFDTKALVSFLVELRSVIADLLGWAVLSLLAIMVVYVVRGRLAHGTPRAGESQGTDGTEVKASGGSSRPKVVVAITAYNDAEATAQTVTDFLRQPGVSKVLVIDNNSTDQTAELATAAGGVVVRETRQGYGFACIRGLSEGLKIPDADVVVLTEGDGSFVADDTAKFLAYMSHTDLVVGNRVVRGLVDTDSQMDYFFTWGNMAVAMLLRLRFWDSRHLGPAGLTDVGCTFRAIRRPALEQILPYLHDGGDQFSLHMLLVAIARGLSVIEIPIRLRRRVGRSKGASQSFMKGLQVGLVMIWDIISFRLEPEPPERPVHAEVQRSAAGNGRLRGAEPPAREAPRVASAGERPTTAKQASDK